MRRWLHWIGALASLVCAVFFFRAVMRHWAAVASIPWGTSLTIAGITALLAYLCTYAVGAGVWQRCLAALGQHMDYRRAAGIVLLSQFAKYLPGNIGHHVGRIALARSAGMDTRVAVSSVLLETLLVISAGVVCSIPAFALLARVLEHETTGAMGLLPIGGVCIVAVLALLWHFGLRRGGLGLPTSLRLRPIPPAWLGTCSSFVLGGSALFVLCNALSATRMGWLDVIGVYSTAWLLGFLMPGSPAGLGVREMVLLLGLAPVYGTSVATMAAALLRLITVAGDGLAFLFATIGKAKSRTVP